MTVPRGFANPLGRNPFAAPQDYWGHPRVSLSEKELETAMRAYCRLSAIPVPKKGKARAKAIGKPRGSIPKGIADSHLPGQAHLFRA